MKTPRIHLLAAAILIASGGNAFSQSAVPDAMNYQGHLTDNDSNPVAPAAPENRVLQFRLYTSPTGRTPVWGEEQTVTIFKGNFSVILGNGTALSQEIPSGSAGFANSFTNATGADIYLGITPQGGAEFAPRQKLISSAFSFRSRIAERVVQTPNSSSTLYNTHVTNLTIAGGRIEGANVLEFGAGNPGKQPDAGKIGYGVFSPAGAPSLDIVGAGTEGNNRRIQFFNEGGAQFKGPVLIDGRLILKDELMAWAGGILQIQSGFNQTGGPVNLNGVTSINDHLTANGGATVRGTQQFTGTAAAPGKIAFQTDIEGGHQMIDLWGRNNGIGIQAYTTYFRSPANFAFFLGGSHVAAQGDAGPSGTRIALLNTNGMHISGDYTKSSDRRLKKDIRKISNALDTVRELEGVNYSWAEKRPGSEDAKQYGFIAQDVREVLPELVGESSDGFLTVNYDGVIPVLVEALKSQQEQIEELRKQRDEAVLNMESLEERLKTIEHKLSGAETVAR